MSLRTSGGLRRIARHGTPRHPVRAAPNRSPRVPRRAGPRPVRAAGNVRACDEDPARGAARAPRLRAHGGRDGGRTDCRFLRISLPSRHHMARPAVPRRHAAGSRRTRGRRVVDRPRAPRMDPRDGRPGTAARLGLHRRVPARGSGPSRWPQGEDALVARRRGGTSIPEGPRGRGSHLGARRQRLHFGRSERGNGPGPGAHRGGSGRRGGAGRGAGDGHVRAPARRSEPVQRAAPAPGREPALASRSRRLGRGASGERPLRSRPGAPGGKEPATSHPRLPQRAGNRACRGDRAAPPGGRPPRPAAVGGQPGGGRRAVRIRQRRSAAPRLPSGPARHAVRLPLPLLFARGARLMKGRVHPAFVVAGAVFVVLLCAAAVRATPSILIVPLEREFGWSRALLSSAVSVNLVLYGLVGPFAAALMERFGIRRTVLVSLGLICAGVAFTSQMRASWQLLLTWGVLVGLGTGTTAMVLGATVVNRWFVHRRGAVMGVLTASTATGQMLFLPLEAHVVEHQGWRAVTFLVASVLALLLPFVALLVRDRPSDLGAQPYGPSPDTPPLVPSRQHPVANALRVLRE